jgi:hypothetical protein
MTSASGIAPKRGYRSAVVLGAAIILLGVAVGIVSLVMAFTSGNAGWLFFLLPALVLARVGMMVSKARVEGAVRVRPIERKGIRRFAVQDFARNNRAWDNVARWEKKYGQGAKDEGSTGPQKKLRSWSLRLKR